MALVTPAVVLQDAVGADDFLGGIAISLEKVVAGEEITSWCALDLENTGEIQIGLCALNFGALFRAETEAPELQLIPLVLSDKKKKSSSKSAVGEPGSESRALQRWADLPQVEVKRLHVCTPPGLAAESNADLSASRAASAESGWRALGSSIASAGVVAAAAGEGFIEKSGYLEKAGRITGSKRFFYLFEDKLMSYEKQKVRPPGGGAHTHGTRC